MINEDSLLYRIALTLVPGIGHVLARNLIAYCGSADLVFREKTQHLLKIPGIGPHTAKLIKASNELKRAEEELAFLQKANIKALFFTDSDFPSRLKHCNDAPILLYYQGNANLNTQRIVGIVGTRKASDYGKTVCHELIENMKEKNILVVSGLAYGIDIAAHKASVKNNISNIGVLGHGLDILYPAVHKPIADKMRLNGGLLTEFISKTMPDRENFPMRNRIIAGMVDALVVVEAANSGGALISAQIANSYNRDVFAFPGKTTDKYSEGCNKLIKQNKAVLIESYKDLEYIMAWEEPTNKKPSKSMQTSLFIELEGDEKIIAELFNEHTELSVDEICFHSKITPGKAASALLNLEFKNLVKSLPGKIYKPA